LCIDQDNKDEKNKQVSQMADVYNKAARVCIWLGDGDPQCELAMDFVNDIINLSELDKLCANKELTPKWYAFAHLLKSRWFSRRWVIQELALAKDAIVRYGDKEVHWVDLADAIAHFVTKFDSIEQLFLASTKYTHQLRTLRDVQAYGANILVETTSSMFRKSEEGEVLDRLATLELLVSSLTIFEASDARDTIFALLSIAKDRDRSRVPTVDYRKDVVEVYKDFFEYCIETSDSLDILCRPWADDGKKKPVSGNPTIRQKALDYQEINLPSWVLRVSDSAFGTPEDSLNGRKNGDNLVGLPNRMCYKACGSRKAQVEFSKKPVSGIEAIPPPETPTIITSSEADISIVSTRAWPDSSPVTDSYSPSGSLSYELRWVLYTRGFRLGKINRRSAPCAEGIIMNECLRMGGWEPGDDMNPVVPEQLWRTLVADRGADLHPPPCWYRRACEHALANVTNSGNLNTRELIADSTQPYLMRQYLKRAQSVTWNRRVIKDYKRNLFGLAPTTAELKDIVCILFGSSVPVILREHCTETGKPDYFEFVGESYIHGKMDGEACEALDHATQAPRTETFEIR
jgi:hypothetical protein